jgi:hypothetical protein
MPCHDVFENNPFQVRIIERTAIDKRVSLRDHDYCFDSFQISQRPPTPPPAPARIAAIKTLPPIEDLSEMDKIANNVAMGVAFDSGSAARDDDGKKKDKKRRKEGKKKKKKKKKHKRSKDNRDSSSR